MSVTEKILEKADVINFAALVAIMLFASLVVCGLAFAWFSGGENIMDAFLQIWDKATIIIMAIFMGYGITVRNNQS